MAISAVNPDCHVATDQLWGVDLSHKAYLPNNSPLENNASQKKWQF